MSYQIEKKQKLWLHLPFLIFVYISRSSLFTFVLRFWASWILYVILFYRFWLNFFSRFFLHVFRFWNYHFVSPESNFMIFQWIFSSHIFKWFSHGFYCSFIYFWTNLICPISCCVSYDCFETPSAKDSSSFWVSGFFWLSVSSVV